MVRNKVKTVAYKIRYKLKQGSYTSAHYKPSIPTATYQTHILHYVANNWRQDLPDVAPCTPRSFTTVISSEQLLGFDESRPIEYSRKDTIS